MINITFDHSKNNLMDSIGVDKQAFDTAKAKIFFHTISRPYIVEELYGIKPLGEDHKMDIVPAELCTSSGILERCLQSAASQAEQLAMFFMFREQNETANQMMSMYLAYKDFDVVRDMLEEKFGNGIKSMIALAIFKERVDHMEQLREVFEYVKAANGSFDIFKSLIPDSEDPIDFLTHKLQKIIEKIDNEKAKNDHLLDEED